MATLADLLEGFDHIETASDLERRLAQGRPLRVKLGLDPTSADLHLGHTVILGRLQRFVDAGHQAILVIGDFTARIGDPSGRNELRPALTDAQITANMKTYAQQAGKVLDLDRVEIRYNSEWLGKLALEGLLRLFSHVTIAQMLKREDFAKRYESGIPIALHELLYPIAQAYDSVELRADVELGGNDQLFNVLMGRHYQSIFSQEPQICLTTPLLEGLDGVKKMSKSLGNAIGVTEEPNDQFGKTMRISDGLIARWAQLILGHSISVTTRLHEDIASGRADPMEEKKRLAEAIVARFHGAESGRQARTYFERTIQRHEVPEEIAQEIEMPSDFRLVDALCRAGFAESKRAAQRLLANGGVRLNNVVITDPTHVPEQFLKPLHLSSNSLDPQANSDIPAKAAPPKQNARIFTLLPGQTLQEIVQAGYNLRSTPETEDYFTKGYVRVNGSITKDPHYLCLTGDDITIDLILAVGNRRFVRLKLS